MILAIILLALSAFFMTRVEMPSWSYAVSSFSVVLFAVPCIWAAKMWLGRRDSIILFAALGLLALLIEISAIVTGFPYGHFGYSNHLGYMLFGIVPWTVAFAWPPLLLGAYSIAAQLTKTLAIRIAITTFVLLIFDLVLDPGAVFLGFWSYADAGAFYGVPVSNFAGWLASGLAGALILELIISRMRPLLPVPIQLSSSAFLIICFWTLLASFAGMTVPAAIGFVTLAVLVCAWRKFHYNFDDRIVLVDENNDPIATASKLAAHDADTHLHRAFSAFIFNRRGELLLQQRSFGKKTWPGVWSNSCCGHVMLHEETAQAAARRLKFELGLSGIKLITALPDFRYRAEKDGVVENEICPVLIGLTDVEPDPNPEEVAAVRWIDWDQFRISLDGPDTGISPWAVQEASLLTQNEVFKNWYSHHVSPSKAPAAV